MSDIIDDAQLKETQLQQHAIDESTRLTRPPPTAREGYCIICKRIIPSSRIDFFATQGIVAFLCGQDLCETTYLKTRPHHITYLDDDVETETPDD